MENPGGAKRRGSRRMFWELAPEDVFGKPAEPNCAKIERGVETQEKQDGKGPSRGLGLNMNTAMQLRGNTLKEFWEIFVDDGPFGADAFCRQVNVQSKAVFSYAMTLIDKIEGGRMKKNGLDPNLHDACGSTQKKL